MKLAYVKWEDCRMMTGDTLFPSEVKPPIIGVDVGLLVKEDDRAVYLCLERFEKESENELEQPIRHVVSIPRRQILECRVWDFNPGDEDGAIDGWNWVDKKEYEKSLDAKLGTVGQPLGSLGKANETLINEFQNGKWIDPDNHPDPDQCGPHPIFEEHQKLNEQYNLLKLELSAVYEEKNRLQKLLPELEKRKQEGYMLWGQEQKAGTLLKEELGDLRQQIKDLKSKLSIYERGTL